VPKSPLNQLEAVHFFQTGRDFYLSEGLGKNNQSPALLPGLIPRSLWSFVSGARRHDPARPNHDQNRVGMARSLHLPALPSPSPHPNFSFGGAIANAGQNPQPFVHVMRHLGAALDQVSKSEYARLRGQDRSLIKGQQYTLLSHRDNLTLEGRRALHKLLPANHRLNVTYLLKESFGQLWDYRRELWARRFFENWQAALKWQRLKPYENFAAMIERHWDGIVAYCCPENKVSLGFVEGLNNKIRVHQRRAYGLRDQEYLRLKILICMLLEL